LSLVPNNGPCRQRGPLRRRSVGLGAHRHCPDCRRRGTVANSHLRRAHVLPFLSIGDSSQKFRSTRSCAARWPSEATLCSTPSGSKRPAAAPLTMPGGGHARVHRRKRAVGTAPPHRGQTVAVDRHAHLGAVSGARCARIDGASAIDWPELTLAAADDHRHLCTSAVSRCRARIDAVGSVTLRSAAAAAARPPRVSLA